MNQEDIDDLMIKNMPQWQQEQLYIQNGNKDLLERLILQEREECALICENIKENYYNNSQSPMDNGAYNSAMECAEQIRARSKG